MCRLPTTKKMLIKTILKTLGFGIAVALIATTTQCARNTVSTENLPEDIFGISVGMNRENAGQHLREIGKMVREDSKVEQVWLLNDPKFSHLAIGYDEEEQVRYVTAIARSKDGQPAFFRDVGDLAKAKLEVAGPNRRYTWSAGEKKSGYLVIAQGTNADVLSLFTLSKLNNPAGRVEEEEDERDK